MNEGSVLKERVKLEAKMVDVFAKEIRMLSTELQEILIDDMVTAFENRINMLNRSKTRSRF